MAVSAPELLVPHPSEDDDFVDPFDRLALKGQSIRPVLPPKHRPAEPTVCLFELADEFGFTTAQALEICDELGVRADHAGTSLSIADANRFRVLALLPSTEPDEPTAPSLRARLNRRKA